MIDLHYYDTSKVLFPAVNAVNYRLGYRYQSIEASSARAFHVAVGSSWGAPRLEGETASQRNTEPQAKKQ